MMLSRRTLFRIASASGAVLAGLALSNRSAVVEAQSRLPRARKTGPEATALDEVDAWARDAASAGPEAVRGYVEAALGVTAFAGSCDSICDRITAAELSFRRDAQPTISATHLADALNRMVRWTWAPAALKTSADELQALRLLLSEKMPHTVSAGETMAPAEAAFMLGLLIQQKLSVPNYRLDLNEVRRRQTQHRRWSAGAPRKAIATLEVRVGDPALAEVQAALREQLPKEWSLATLGLHLCLSFAGVPG